MHSIQIYTKSHKLFFWPSALEMPICVDFFIWLPIYSSGSEKFSALLKFFFFFARSNFQLDFAYVGLSDGFLCVVFSIICEYIQFLDATVARTS